MRPVHLIGVPLDLGGNRRGTDMGPSAFRIAGLGEQVMALGWPLLDKGDIVTPIPERENFGDSSRRYVDPIARVCADLFASSLESLNDGALPLVLGGDHSLGAGSVAATAAWLRQQGQAVGVLWIDAHGDMNTPSTSGSGNVHGMPMAALLGDEPRELSRFAGDPPTIDAQHTVLVGIRNLDDREKERIRAAGVHVFTMKEIDRLGVAQVMERALEIAGDGTGGLHVSFDLDVCDPAIAPGVGTPVKGGLDYREAHVVMELIAETGKLRALDLVEVNPTLDLRNTTAEFGVELVLSALGKQIL